MFKPSKKQIEIIVEMVSAKMPLEHIARAVGANPDELVAWRRRMIQGPIDEAARLAALPMQVRPGVWK